MMLCIFSNGIQNIYCIKRLDETYLQSSVPVFMIINLELWDNSVQGRVNLALCISLLLFCAALPVLLNALRIKELRPSII